MVTGRRSAGIALLCSIRRLASRPRDKRQNLPRFRSPMARRRRRLSYSKSSPAIIRSILISRNERVELVPTKIGVIVQDAVGLQIGLRFGGPGFLFDASPF